MVLCRQVDLRHIDEVRGSSVVDIGVDLSEFYTSVEWDILEVPAVRCVRTPSSYTIRAEYNICQEILACPA